MQLRRGDTRPKLSPVDIRLATSGDLDATLALYAQLQPDDPPFDLDAARSVYEDILQREGLDFLVGVDDAAVVGSIYVNIIPNLTRGLRSYAVLENVIVDDTRRGTGLGKQLMAAALDHARAAGCYKAMLLTGSSNPDTHAFYRACGFDGDAKQGYLVRW